MHTYYRLFIYLDGYKDKLNRVIECRNITELSSLACGIMASFKASGKKNYYFNINDKVYECDEARVRQKVTNATLPTHIALSRMEIDKFKFVYDYDQKYEFIVEKIEQKDDVTWRKAPLIISGKGFGIIEDNKAMLESFMDGQTSIAEVETVFSNRKKEIINNFEFDEVAAHYYNDYNRIRKKRNMTY